MARKMSEAKSHEFDELKRFFEAWELQISPTLFPDRYSFSSDHPHHPLNVLRAIGEQFGRSRALEGLKQAVNDTLEDAEELYGPEVIALIDDALRQLGTLTLTQLLTRRHKSFKGILRRGKIRNDTEFYLISSALSDTSIERPEAEVAALNSLAVDSEAQRRSKRDADQEQP